MTISNFLLILSNTISPCCNSDSVANFGCLFCLWFNMQLPYFLLFLITFRIVQDQSLYLLRALGERLFVWFRVLNPIKFGSHTTRSVRRFQRRVLKGPLFILVSLLSFINHLEIRWNLCIATLLEYFKVDNPSIYIYSFNYTPSTLTQ